MKKTIGILFVLVFALSFSLVATPPVAAGSGPPVTGGLVLRLDASEADSILKDGANRVSQWNDLSVSGNHATQATLANRPVWVDNVLAGKPVIRFDGSDDYLAANTVASFLSGEDAPYSALAVIRRSTADRQDAIYSFGLSTSTTPVINARTTSGADTTPNQLRVLRRDNGNTLKDARGGEIGIDPTIISIADSGTLLNAYHDGTRIITNADVNVGTITLDLFSVGVTRIGSSFFHYLSGDIAEILIYNRALSDSEREAVEQYLRVKWLGKCVATATGTGNACLGVTQGGIEGLSAVAAPSLPSVNFPHGMFSFQICCLTPGATVDVTVTLPSNVPVGTVWWKYDNGRWYSLPNLNDNGNNIMVIRLTDGGTGDMDNTPGRITDPGGPGNPMTVGIDGSPVSRAAVVGPWVALLAVIVAGVSLLVCKRRRGEI